MQPALVERPDTATQGNTVPNTALALKLEEESQYAAPS